jgi:hypothetical protein
VVAALGPALALACNPPAPHPTASSAAAPPSAGAAQFASPTGKVCRDSGDCPAPKKCCLGFGTAEPDVGCFDVADCWEEACRPGGSSCPKGTACTGSASSFGPKATCTSPKVPVACGPKRCTADKPICVSRKGKPECDKTDSPFPEPTDGDVKRLACTSAAECGGDQRCCLGQGASSCAVRCNPGTTPTLCASDAECPSMAPHCKPNDEKAPWLKACTN